MYYPQQRFASQKMQFKRQVKLPEEAIGNIQVEQGYSIEVRDVVARGLIPAKHYIIDAMTELNERDPDAIEGLLLVRRRARVQAGELIAGKDASRGRRVFAPVDGLVITVSKGRIIFQAMPTIISLEAGVRGKVAQTIDGRSVEIEGIGGIVQGVWGNGRNVIATLRVEPEAGILSIQRDTLDSTYSGEVVVTRSPLSEAMLEIGEARNFSGIIAPSMNASMIDRVRETPMAIMLTVGFGQPLMSLDTFNLFEKFSQQQVALDAAEPRRFDERRPEAVFSQTTNEQMVARAEFIGLERGVDVRVTAAPYHGRVGTISQLPAFPLELANGLRVPCAVVRLTGGQMVDVPLANIEVAGT